MVTHTSLIVGLFRSYQKVNCAADEHSIILNAIRAQNSDKAKELKILHMKHIQNGLAMEAQYQTQNNLTAIFG